MKKNKVQGPIPKDFFPGDSEEFKIEGPSDSFIPSDSTNNNKYSLNMNSIIKSNNTIKKNNLQDSSIANSNKFKDDYIPKKIRTDNEDDELEAMLTQTKMKQQENKLKEKSIVINPSQNMNIMMNVILIVQKVHI